MLLLRKEKLHPAGCLISVWQLHKGGHSARRAQGTAQSLALGSRIYGGSHIRYPIFKLLSAENKSILLPEKKKKNMQKKSNYNKTEESPHPWGVAQQWMKEICKLFYMLLLSFLTLLSLVVPLFARLKRGGKAACQVLKFAVEGPFFRWKTELQTELPNPTSTFKVWLILCQKWHLPLKA